MDAEDNTQLHFEAFSFEPSKVLTEAVVSVLLLTQLRLMDGWCQG